MERENYWNFERIRHVRRSVVAGKAATANVAYRAPRLAIATAFP